MSSPSVTATAARVTQVDAPTPTKAVLSAAPAPVQNAPAAVKADGPAASVTISESAKLAAAASTQPAQPAAPAGDATRAARAAVVHASSSAASSSQTTASQYEARVRAALGRGGDRSVSQIMSSLGVPQAEQAQVAAALGAASKSTS